MRETETQRDRETERDRERQRDKDIDREIETRHSQGQTDRQTNRGKRACERDDNFPVFCNIV